ncbi:MAG: dTMP kinase [Candidatus Nanopelagicales bacterium]|nr:dTMP kinase [Candidatus Nanopelagicales bacterium]
MRSRGSFIVFEGGEGAGKSTQVKLLAAALRSDGLDVVTTREPGGSPVGERIRDLLLDPATGSLHPRAEALLFAAARADHVATLIEPGLARGAVVICDRFVDSSLAYQGVARHLGLDEVARLSSFATNGLTPDLTIVLDVDPVAGLERARRSAAADRIESEELNFHRQVRQAFIDLSAADPDRYLVVPASSGIGETAEAIAGRVSELVGHAGGPRIGAAEVGS